ncbi:hypothetical protein DQE80_16850, partial [Enterococcus sp. HPCN18]
RRHGGGGLRNGGKSDERGHKGGEDSERTHRDFRSRSGNPRGPKAKAGLRQTEWMAPALGLRGRRSAAASADLIDARYDIAAH